MLRVARRVVVVGWVCALGWVAGLAVAPVSALGEGTASAGSSAGGAVQADEGSGASSSLGGPLVTPGSPTQGEQAQAGEEAKLANPNAVAERKESQTKFENLNSEQASSLAVEIFPAVINNPAGGPPKLPAGESIVGYPIDNAAQVDLPEGKHGIIESLAPIAVETSPGQRVPVDLGLSEVGGAFEPKTPVVGVRIPKRLGDGVSLGSTGVSLTPVDAQGASLGGSEGAVDGAGVFYANTLTDADTVIKPTTAGFEAYTMLRSVESPHELSFRVGVPAGASLVQGTPGSGTAQVIDEGAVLASVLAPTARDAAGTPVPVSMSVSGDVLTLSVADSSGEYQYPLEVDPGFTDEELTGASKPTRWKFGPTGATHFTSSGWKGAEGLTVASTGTYKAGEKGYLYYETQGESKIEQAWVESSEKNTGNIETVLQTAHLNGSEEVREDSELLAAAGHEYGESSWLTCDDFYVYGECNEPEEKNYGAPHNLVKLQQSPTAEGSGENIAKLYSARVDIYQAHGPEKPTFNTSSSELYNGKENTQNVLHYPYGWLSPHSGVFEVKTKDPGIGISDFTISGGGWGLNEELVEKNDCEGLQCFPEFNETFAYNKSMVDGEDAMEVMTQDGYLYRGEYSPSGDATIKVDGTAPVVTLTGLPANGVINEAQYHLRAQATDGKAPTPSSGVKSLVLALDGYVLPGQSGTCTPGPCTATGEWTINGEEFGAGKHTLTVQAIDNAGNEESKPYSITVRHANPLPVGPGSVDPITGALHLGASDVSMSGGIGSLGVSRSYNSRQLTAGEQGPLGPQWSLNISGARGVEREPTGSVVLIGSDGIRTTFESNGAGGFISPRGDENLVLSAEKEGETIKAYLLKDPAAGTTVKYTQPGGSGPWVIASSEGVLSKTSGGKETVEWERVENVTRPKLALAPVASGVTCSKTVKEPKELAVGCRALSFTYATETTATGEAPSQWKAYKGRLMTVSFTAYNPSTKAMETKPVAEYAYDIRGRLRAEWDPRITPSPLKTTYGYDSEGHVVAVNPPGEEPWLIHYGTTTSDTSAGRLLSVTRPPAGTATQVKEQDEKVAPANTAVPTLSSTSPVIGTTLSISSNGTWSNSPLTYSDAWEDCYTYETSEGPEEKCTVIPGAVNSSYTPQPHDAGYTLRAEVTAVNADGSSSVARSSASSVLADSAPAYLSKWGESGEAQGQFKSPASAAVDASGNVWVVDSSNSRVQEFSSTGTFIKTFGWDVGGKAEFQICTSGCKAGTAGSGAGEFSKPAGIAINQSTGNVYVVDKGNNRIEQFNSEGKYVGAFGKYGKEPGELNAPLGVAIMVTSGDVWVSDSGNNRIDEFSKTGESLGFFGSEGSGSGQFKGPDGIAFSGEDAYVVDSGNDRVQEFSMSGQYRAKFGSKGTGNGQFETPDGISTEPVSGDLYVSDYGNDRIEEFSPAGVFLVAFGKKGTGTDEFTTPEEMAVSSTGDLYVADTGNNRVQELKPGYVLNTAAPEPPALGTSAVTTVDYNVPLAGSGAPHEMTKTELGKWGQSDDPAEPVPGESLATAVFPPDEPMGWPAKDYKRATITYLDELGRTVNRATPSGAIETSEYNETNEVKRSLSADNRVAALKEANPREASELLDTKSKYNGETTAEKEKEEKEGVVEPGTRLLEVRGPQHTVKLSTGSEVKARAHVKYYYDEGSPGGERYDLVTKTTDGAEYEGKEADVRTSTTSYSGQENLGWLLRKPTSVTTAPSGLKITHTTLYNRSTGAVAETLGPKAGGVAAGTYSYFSKMPSVSLSKPQGVVVDSSGHVWVADTEDSRVVELSTTGELINSFGSVYKEEPKTEKRETVVFNKPRGIAVDSAGHIWVADTGIDRVVEFSSTGELIRDFGSEGTETGEFKKPTALAIDSSGNVWVADTENNRVQEFSSTGTYLRDYSSGFLKSPEGIAADAQGDVFVSSTGLSVPLELSSEAKRIGLLGSVGSGAGQLKEPAGLVIAGEDVYVVDRGNHRVEEFKRTTNEWGETSGEYVAQFGTSGAGNGQFNEPQGIALDKEGHLWVADAGNNRMQEFTPTPGSADATQTIYYSAGTRVTYPACGEHPEWANLRCRSQPAAQPAQGPPLPVVTDTSYNIWDEPETITEEFGSTTRTKKLTYDAAGRALTSEETATGSSDTTVPKVTNEYSSETGVMIKQSTTAGETTKSIKSVYDTLGRLTEYTDADGNATEYTYSGSVNDGQVEEVKYGDSKGSQMYSYDPTTKALTKLLDVGPEGGKGAGTFTAGYDMEGKMSSETYPNGMTVEYIFNPSSEATGIEYKKTAHCAGTCPEVWFKEAVVPSIHGEALRAREHAGQGGIHLRRSRTSYQGQRNPDRQRLQNQNLCVWRRL